MARVDMRDVRPWGGRMLTLPPKSLDAWIRLAAWEAWMGMLASMVFGLGVLLIVTSPDHIVAVSDLSNCYAPPPVAVPCERIVYRGGALYLAFSALCGLMLIGVAGWFVWELWNAVEPKPIADDFLKLLNDSFGRDWRNPLKWPWARVMWAYGFTSVGAALTAAVAASLWVLLAASKPALSPTVTVETSATVTVGR